jgi:hypothetical protein
MQRMKLLASALFLSSMMLGSALGANAPASGDFDGCPVEGKDGDIALNELKNRSAVPSSAAAHSISGILNLPDPGVTNRLPRDKWTNAQLSKVDAHEKQGIVVQGVLIAFKREGLERCNCRKSDLNDFHLWLAARGDLAKEEAMVVEVTPRWRNANPSWSEAALKQLKKARAKVRITGWLLYDQDHLNEIGNSRATVWEIHPITKIEVFLSGAWQEL